MVCICTVPALVGYTLGKKMLVVSGGGGPLKGACMALALEGLGFDFGQGHIPRLMARFPVGSMQEAADA